MTEYSSATVNGALVLEVSAPRRRPRVRRIGRPIAAMVASLLVMSCALTFSAQVASAADSAPVMVVLDGSGSMLAPDGGGTKIDAAKAAVHQMVGELPDSARLGLEVYGTHTGSSDAEKTAGCQDVSVVHPVAPLDRAGIGGAVDAVAPQGYTPIGQSLRHAADALPNEGPRSIVLVSDGEDTCAPPDPCDVARELKQRGIDLTVHTVGLGVDDKTRSQLTCVADVTGGTYNDSDTGSLGKVLPRVTASAMRNYEVSGTPISGSVDKKSAPTLTAGQYRDALGPNDKKYYAVDVPDGWTLYASSTVAYQRSPAAGSGQEGTGTALYGPDGSSCDVEDTASTGQAQDGEALATGVDFDSADRDSTDCRGGGHYLIEVSRDGDPSYAHGAALPTELLIGLEPPLQAKQSTGSTVPFADPGGADQPVVGSGSFTTATELPAAGHYVDTIQHGETLFFKVHLPWGRAMSYRLRFEPLGTSDNPGTAQTSTTLFNPARETVDHGQSAYNDGPATLPSGSEALSTPTIAYGNRDSSDDETENAAIPGWYYLSVKLGEAGADNAAGSPVRLHVDLSLGGSVQSPPPYTDATPDQATGDGIFVSSESTPEGQVHASGRAPMASAGGSPSSGATPWLIGGGIVLVLVIGIGGSLLVRYLRRSSR